MYGTWDVRYSFGEPVVLTDGLVAITMRAPHGGTEIAGHYEGRFEPQIRADERRTRRHYRADLNTTTQRARRTTKLRFGSSRRVLSVVVVSRFPYEFLKR